MMRKKILKMAIISSLALGNVTYMPNLDFVPFPFVSVAHAEVKTYIGVGKCRFDFGEDDPDMIKKAQAVAQNRAILAAREKAGVYIKSYTKTINASVTEDSISTITNIIVDTVDVKYNKMPAEMDGDIGVRYEAIVTVKIDTNGISNYLKIAPQKQVSFELQNKELQEVIDNNNKKFENLEQNSIKAKTNEERNKVKADINKAYNELLYNQKIKEGVKFSIQGYYDKAINSYNEAIKFDPKNSSPYIKIAYIYRWYLGNYDKALENINKAIEIEPLHGYQTRAFLYEALRQYDKALADFNKMIEINPKDIFGYSGRANIYNTLGQKEKALEELTKAVEIEPNNPSVYRWRGNLYEKLEQYDKAIADYSKEIELSSLSNTYDGKFAAYDRRIDSYKKMNKYNEAIADLTERINISNDDALKAAAYDKRGSFYRFYLKMPEKANSDDLMAIDLYTKAISKNNDPKKISSYYNNCASLHKRMNKYDEAIADYTKAIEFDPRNSLAYNFRGSLYKELKRYKEAIADYSKSIELLPGELGFPIYIDLGNLYRELKQYNKAINIYNKIIAINPKYALAYTCRGECYEAMGNNAKAQVDFDKAKELG